jgi:hypothetical protein
VKKLTALFRLALALGRSSGFTLAHRRLPDGRAKIRILQAVDRAHEFVPLRALLPFRPLSPGRFHAWRRLQHASALDDQSSLSAHVAPSTYPSPGTSRPAHSPSLRRGSAKCGPPVPAENAVLVVSIDVAASHRWASIS